jgi:hypothetical protein
MKKLLITAIAIIAIGLYGKAQKQYIPPTYSSGNSASDSKNFNKDNIFVGGSLALGFGSYSFNIGGTPEIGYSFNEWFDAGLAFNINYQSIRADPYYNNNVRQRSFNYGGGPFLRVFPMKQFFVQGQFEKNWINYNYTNMNSGGGSSTFNTQSSSFLAGIGFTQRIVGQSSFYTVLMMDLMTDRYSPYRDYNNAAIPIIRAGFTFYLHPKRR